MQLFVCRRPLDSKAPKKLSARRYICLDVYEGSGSRRSGGCAWGERQSLKMCGIGGPEIRGMRLGRTAVLEDVWDRGAGDQGDAPAENGSP